MLLLFLLLLHSLVVVVVVVIGVVVVVVVAVGRQHLLCVLGIGGIEEIGKIGKIGIEVGTTVAPIPQDVLIPHDIRVEDGGIGVMEGIGVMGGIGMVVVVDPEDMGPARMYGTRD